MASKFSVVTGAGSGIGRAIATALAERSDSLWLVGRSIDKLAETAIQVRLKGAEACCCAMDVTSDDAVFALAERLRHEAKELDLVVHSAGEIALGPVASTPIRILDWLYRTNLRAPYLITQLLLPIMRTKKGAIVFINSSAGLSAAENQGLYAASKAGLKAVADSLRAEVSRKGIRVLSVYPGRTATPMQEAVHAMEGRPYQPHRLAQPEDVAAMVVSALGLPRSAEVTDLTVRAAHKPPSASRPRVIRAKTTAVLSTSLQ